MKKILILALLSVITLSAAPAQDRAADQTKAIFLFEPQNDMFHMRESSHNQAEWLRLSGFVNKYKSIIRSGEIKVFVTSYSLAMPTAPANRLLAKTMANRVKSELILKNGLREEDFKTQNKPEAYEGKSPVVVVEITVPDAITASPERIVDTPPVASKQDTQPAQEPKPETEPIQVSESVQVTKNRNEFSRWSLGFNIGVPFIYGDMVSWEAHNHYYMGFMGGIQTGFQMTPALGLSITADYGQNKAGSRIRDKRYNLSTEGIVYERFQDAASGVTVLEFNDLYQKSEFLNLALHLDLNINRLFTSRPNTINVLLSPGVYAQNFTSNIFSKTNDSKFVTKEYNDWNIGAGGDIAVRFRVSNTVDLQVKATAIWINNDKFDNIQNNLKDYTHWMWGGSAGIVFKLGGNQRVNLFYK